MRDQLKYAILTFQQFRASPRRRRHRRAFTLTSFMRMACCTSSAGVLSSQQVHDFVFMGLRRARRNMEERCDFLHSPALRDQLQHLPLASG